MTTLPQVSFSSDYLESRLRLDELALAQVHTTCLALSLPPLTLSPVLSLSLKEIFFLKKVWIPKMTIFYILLCSVKGSTNELTPIAYFSSLIVALWCHPIAIFYLSLPIFFSQMKWEAPIISVNPKKWYSFSRSLKFKLFQGISSLPWGKSTGSCKSR